MFGKIFFFGSFLFGSKSTERMFDLSYGQLLIYTDTKIDNLNISYKKDAHSVEENIELKDETKTFGINNFLIESFVYKMKLPNVPKGKIL